MSDTPEAIRIISTVESFLPIVVGLVRDLKALLAGASDKSADQILAEADANWNAVLAAAKRGSGDPIDHIL